MKVRHIRQTKVEGVKLKWELKRIKQRLRKKFPDLKNMFAPQKNSKINVDGSENDDVQNIPISDKSTSLPTKKTVTPPNVKHKKKRLSNRKTDYEPPPDIQYYLGDSTKWDNPEQQVQEKDNDWKLNNSEEETEGKMDDDWIQVTPKEQKNTDSSLTMEVLSQNFTSLDLPKTSKYQQKTSLIADVSYNKHTNESSSSNNKSVLVIADVNLERNAYLKKLRPRNQKQASSASSSKLKNKGEFTSNTLGDISVNNNAGSFKREELFHKNRSPGTSLDRSNDATACGSPRRENVNLQPDVCDHNRPNVYCIRNMVIVIMKSESKFSFSGKLLVRVLYGAVKIYGFTLDVSNGVKEVYSPRTYSNVAVETSEIFPEGSVEDVWKALDTDGITRDSESKLQADIDEIQPGTAVIVLENFENNLTLFLKTYCPFKLFPNINNPHYVPWTSPKRAEIVLQAKLYFVQYDTSPTYKRLTIDSRITTDIAEIMLSHWRASKWSCALIAGGKNVGKSTSVRCLINSLLRASGKVVLVDVDPGQAECTPAGCISYSLIEEPLMGPNFTHLRTPVYQLFIDEINVVRCVTRYLTGIKMLIEMLKACPVLSRLPVVVNTMGFTQDIGWNIAIITIKLIKPSVVLQIKSMKKKNNFIEQLSKDVVNSQQECGWMFCDSTFVNWDEPCNHDFYMFNSYAESKEHRADVRANEWHLEPYQQRDLVMMSYLSDIVREINNSSQYNAINAGLSFSINEVIPYRVPFSSLCIILQTVLGVPASHALSVINGNIVALCGIDLTEESLRESENMSSLRVLTQRSPLCTCYGFDLDLPRLTASCQAPRAESELKRIIRGIDMERQEVFLITPLSSSILQHINCLAGCTVTPPALLQLSQNAPYISENTALPTNREPHRKYFRKKYQNSKS